MKTADSLTCLTGGTGYIGGRLLPLLESRGVRVRCLTRRPESLRNEVSSGTDVVRADVLDRDSLTASLEGVEVAYYLVHSMGTHGSFEENDRQAATNFALAAKEDGVRRIVYLGGLGDPGQQLSPHLRSRHEVGEILQSSGAQVVEFRASIIIGSGSLSFEPERRLRLAAEMRLPGRAWLEFEVSEHEGNSKIRQTAIFDPVGLPGLAYWYALYPLHQLVFAGMLSGIARSAERAS